MNKFLCILIALSPAMFICNSLQAQKILITGTVKNSVTNESISAVSVSVKNMSEKVFGDDKGNIRINCNGKFPVNLIISSMGFETQELVINKNEEMLEVRLKPAGMLGGKIVVSATL